MSLIFLIGLNQGLLEEDLSTLPILLEGNDVQSDGNDEMRNQLVDFNDIKHYLSKWHIGSNDLHAIIVRAGKTLAVSQVEDQNGAS
jgi:hypothetical protein